MSPLYLPTVYEKLFDGLNTGKISLSEFMVQKDFNLSQPLMTVLSFST